MGQGNGTRAISFQGMVHRRGRGERREEEGIRKCKMKSEKRAVSGQQSAFRGWFTAEGAENAEKRILK